LKGDVATIAPISSVEDDFRDFFQARETGVDAHEIEKQVR
jgi:hypothetical protein